MADSSRMIGGSPRYRARSFMAQPFKHPQSGFSISDAAFPMSSAPSLDTNTNAR